MGRTTKKRLGIVFLAIVFLILILSIQFVSAEKEETSFHRKVRILVAEGKLDLSIARGLIKAFEKTQK